MSTWLTDSGLIDLGEMACGHVLTHSEIAFAKKDEVPHVPAIELDLTFTIPSASFSQVTRITYLHTTDILPIPCSFAES